MRGHYPVVLLALIAIVAGGCAAPGQPTAERQARAGQTILSPGQGPGYMLSLRQEVMASVAGASRGDEMRLSWLSDGSLLLRASSDSVFRAAAARLQREGRILLRGLAQNLTDYPATIVHILVYTDNTGRRYFNHKLSRRRAEAISSYLRTFGVASVRVQASGRGGRQPVARNDTVAGRRRNRRVDIVISPLIRGREDAAYRAPQEPLP